ncbi:MAG: M28 family metallopeptidase [Planctomycetota bacterium]|nr:M28 family metallopeptidase [Planctomycetota bacterium]
MFSRKALESYPPCNALCFRIVVAILAVLSLPCFGQITPWNPVNQVSQTQYTAYQLSLQNMGLGLYGGPSYDQGYRNRYNAAGTANASLGFNEARLFLKDQFTAMGLAVSEQGAYSNIVAELKGTENPQQVYIISGHYDHREDNTDAPGGDDNASGTAGVLEAARVLSQYHFKSTVRFIAWGGEEGWMLGSWDYVRNVVKKNSDPANQNVAGVLNMDMILRPGWDSQPDHVKDLDLGTRWEKAGCLDWANQFRNSAALYAPDLIVNPITHGSESEYYEWYASDQGPFMRMEDGYLYPSLMIAENTANEIWYKGTNAYYHTFNDASDRLANDPNNGSGITYDYDFATNVVRTAVGTIAAAAVIVPEPSGLFLLLGCVLVLRRRTSRTAQ